MRIGIIGAGTWGMALARMLSNSGHVVEVWSPHSETVDLLAATRIQKNLPDMIIPEEVRLTKEMEQVCKDKDMVVFAVPSIYVRPAARQANPFVHTLFNSGNVRYNGSEGKYSFFHARISFFPSL